jgi:hypothetical protein
MSLASCEYARCYCDSARITHDSQAVSSHSKTVTDARDGDNRFVWIAQ